jgi:4-amino-4-deoxy-L-arabinose transferase-like glycosyltransferase
MRVTFQAASTRRAVFFGLLIVLLAGSAAAFRFAAADPSARSVYNLDADTSTYDALARQVVQTGSLRLIPPYWPPGFIVWLAAIYKLFGAGYLAAKLVQCVLLALVACAAAFVMWHRAGPLEGLIAGSATIASPVLVDYAATLQYELFAAFLTTVIAAILVFTPRSRLLRVVHALSLAVLCACAALVREPLALLFPVCLGSVVVKNRSLQPPRGRHLALMMAAAFAAIVGSWSVLLYQQTGRLLIISEKSDVNFRIGNNPNANGTSNAPLNGIAEPSGWRFIRTQPARAAWLDVQKSLYFWGVRRDPWTVPQESTVVLSRALLNLVPLQMVEAGWNAVVCLCFFAGAAMSWRKRELIPLALIVALVMAAHVLYFGAQRFAVPVTPLIYMVAALPVAAFGRAALQNRGVVLIVAAAWIGIAQFLSFGGRYHAEAEDLEGISAENTTDPLANNGVARFAASAKGARPVAFLSSVVFPQGAFAIHVRARAADCGHPDAVAITVILRDEQRQPKQTVPFRVADLCGPTGYHLLSSVGSLHRDEIVYLYVTTEGVADVFIDSVDVDLGYRRRIDLPVR